MVMRDQPEILRVRPVGIAALMIEVSGDNGPAALSEQIRSRRGELGLSPLAEVVPGARSVVVDGVDNPEVVARALVGWAIPRLTGSGAPLVEIPTVYDGEDLEEVAAACGLRREAVVRLHAGAAYRVAFCGFVPGFAYLTGLPSALRAVPRRHSPRRSVPAGSVAIAGGFSGIYPRATPGGWRLLGRTDVSLWDPAREQPALLAPGARVRFVITEGAHS